MAQTADTDWMRSQRLHASSGKDTGSCIDPDPARTDSDFLAGTTAVLDERSVSRDAAAHHRRSGLVGQLVRNRNGEATSRLCADDIRNARRNRRNCSALGGNRRSRLRSIQNTSHRKYLRTHPWCRCRPRAMILGRCRTCLPIISQHKDPRSETHLGTEVLLTRLAHLACTTVSVGARA